MSSSVKNNHIWKQVYRSPVVFFWQKNFFRYNRKWIFIYTICMPLAPENQFQKTYKNELFATLVEKWVFYVVKKNFLSIPLSIRMVGFSLFVFVLWRGLWADVFFSLYIKNIVNHVFLISIIGAILSLSKMFFSIPIGEINNHANLKSVLFLSKFVYIVMGVVYVFAGIYSSVVLLVLAVLLNGLATASLFTTYQTFIRKNTRWGERGRSFGLYFSSINLAYIVGALISSYLITKVDLPHLFIFIPIFALLSLLTDKKLPSLSKKKIKEFLAGQTFTQRFIYEVFSFRPIKKVIVKLKNYSGRMYYALGFEVLFNLLNYVGFIFIPIVSIANDLSLSQVALVFAAMRLPYLIDFFTWDIAGNGSKRKFLFIMLFFLSLLYLLLWFNEGFRNIMVITFGISLWLSLMRPVISAYISDCTRPEDEGTITGVGEFVGKLGEIVGVLWFGLLSAIFSLQTSFVIIWIFAMLLAIAGIIKRFRFFKYDG